MKSYEHLKKQLLKDKRVQEAYDALGPEFAVARAIIEKRTQKGYSQAALAKKIGTKQSAIARLESGGHNPSLVFLHKVADALDAKLTIALT